jgi:hypothetical protein
MSGCIATHELAETQAARARPYVLCGTSSAAKSDDVIAMQQDIDARRQALAIARRHRQMAFVIALLTALGSVLSACANGNTFNYGHGRGQCENCGDHY